jgi:phosphodiesterase/alkaline phosphatase D-like protein
MRSTGSTTGVTGGRHARAVLVLTLLTALLVQLAQALTAQAAVGVSWVWSGALTSTSIVVKARTAADSASVRLLVSRSADLSAPLTTPKQASTAAMDRVVTLPVSGLTPATRYHYAVEVDGTVDLTKRGTFRTAPEGASSFTIAFGACATTGSDSPVFDTIRQADPLFFFHTGDLHYEDIATADTGLFRGAYDRVLASPRQSRLYRDVPIAYMWDDHDYGPNNADGNSPSKPAARQVYRERVPHHPLAAGTGDVSPYQAFTVGRVRFLVTDGRSERSPSGARDDAAKTMLGAAQKAWLKSELLAARDQQALTVWVNTMPWVAPATTGGDHWGGYTTERRELADFIRDNRIDRTLVMLSGDAHMVSAEDGTHSGYATGGGGGFPVLHAAALDRAGSVKGGPYSHGTFPGSGQFGLLSVEDTGGDEVTVTYSGRRTDGSELVRLAATVGDHLDRAPAVAAVTPVDGAAGIRVTTDVTARFSEPVDPATVSGATFTLTPAPSPADPAPTPVPAVVTLDPTGNTARVDPVADLLPGRAYRARVTGVRDPLGNVAPERTWSFTTAAAVVDLAPVADTYVSSSATTTNYGTSSTLMVDGDPKQVTYLKFDLTPYAGRELASASLDLRVTSNATQNKPTLRAVADDSWTETGLSYSNRPAVGSTVLGTLPTTTTNTTYTVPVAAAAVAGELGGTLTLAVQPAGTDGLLLASRETLTPPVLSLAFEADTVTDTQAPTVTAVSPADGAAGVDPASRVTARFSEPLDASTVTGATFTLTPAGATSPVTAVVTLDAAGDTATLDPSADLAAGTTYTARVSGVRDRAGNPAADRTWTFTTEALPRTVTLLPTADTYVSSGATTTAFGTKTSLSVDGSPTDVAYLKYDLTPYAGRVLTGAALSVRVTTNASKYSPTVRHVAHDGWTESALTYATRPAYGKDVLATLPRSATGTTYTVPLATTALVPEVGSTLTVAVVAGGTDGLLLGSRESSTPPRLELQLG